MSKERHPLTRFTLEMLPFADAASEGLPLKRLVRMSLFQVSVGMATVLLLGTLNRVMIVELSVPAMLVACMIALPVLVAPFRALLGFRSDTHKSAIGWKRVPYLWFGSLYQFGGLAIMPFALILLSGDQTMGPAWAGEAIAAVAFLMTGLGLHMTQTAGLALASDQATDETRPRVVALLYVMFLLGMAVSAIMFGLLLADFSKLRLIQVIQGSAVVTLALNLIALWKQEKMSPMSRAERAAPRPAFRDAWGDLMAGGTAGRLLLVVALGTCAFSMQDVLLEPYGGEILGLSVSATTVLTALWAGGSLIGFALAGRWLARGKDPARLAAHGAMAGVIAFSSVIFAAPMHSPVLFFAGAAGIGYGAGLFAIATLTYAMTMPKFGVAGAGLALGAWGAAQATAAGVGIALGGTIRDAVRGLTEGGAFGPAMAEPYIGYTMVYHLEIGLLFVTLIAIAPLVRTGLAPQPDPHGAKLGLAEFPS
jgi:BCD family chlorophyll transporter-like MFS transporter